MQPVCDTKRIGYIKIEEIYVEMSEISYLSRGCMQHYFEQPHTLVLQEDNT